MNRKDAENLIKAAKDARDAIPFTDKNIHARDLYGDVAWCAERAVEAFDEGDDAEAASYMQEAKKALARAMNFKS